MANYNDIKNAALIAPTTVPDLGSENFRYGNVYLSGNVNIAGTSITSTNALTPRIASIGYPGDDTAADIIGSQTITLNGSGFNYGASVYVSGLLVSIVSVVDPSQITFISTAKIAGNYALVVVNPDGASATFVPGMQYSGVPTWTTAAGSLGAANSSAVFSATLAAISDSTVTYSISSGSLPSGVMLNSSSGVISGTMPIVSVSTTYNFTVRATDGEKQDTDRNFSVNVAPAAPSGQISYSGYSGGSYSWVAPAGVTSVCVVCVGGGGGAGQTSGYAGGGGGALAYKNNIAVTPGQAYAVVVGDNGSYLVNATSSYFINTTTVCAGGGRTPTDRTGAAGGTVLAGTGGAGGAGGTVYAASAYGGNGGGVGLQGTGAGGAGAAGGVGAPGSNGIAGSGGTGKEHGGGSGGSQGGGPAGAVRIIWGPSRAFPSTLTADQ